MTVAEKRKIVFVLRRGPVVLSGGKTLLSGESAWQPAEVLSEENNVFYVRYFSLDENGHEETKVAPDRIQPFVPGNDFWQANPQFATDPSVQAALNATQTPPANPPTDLYLQEKAEFLRNLYSYMDSIGQPIIKTPFLGYQELDLYHLYQIVTRKGGMDEVTRKQEWKSVYQELGIPTMSTSASYNTRTNYKKYLYLYELKYFTPTVEKLLDDDKLVNFAYPLGAFVKIESTSGQTYYAQVVKRRHQALNLYYIHYNGWSTSHDEWMPEGILLALNEQEAEDPKKLTNPMPSRSSKSNYLISDPHYMGTVPLMSGYSSGKSSGHRTLSTTSRDSESASEQEGERETQVKKRVKRKSAPKSFVYPEYDERDETGYATDNSSELPQAKTKHVSPQKPVVPVGTMENLQPKLESKRMAGKERKTKHRITRNNLHLNALQIDTPIEIYGYLDDVYPNAVEEQDIKNTIQSIQTLKEEIETQQASIFQQRAMQKNGAEKSDTFSGSKESKMDI